MSRKNLGLKASLKIANNFDTSIVLERYIQDYSVSLKTAKLHERELKKFLTLSACSSNGYGMAGPVDNYWHTFLLFTREYSEFCKSIGSGKFLHHIPISDDKRRGNSKRVNCGSDGDGCDSNFGCDVYRYGSIYSKEDKYKQFLLDYKKYYSITPPSVWPRKEKADSVCSSSG